MDLTNWNDPNVLIVAGAAILLLVAVLILLARSGRKPPEGPAAGTPAELSPVAPDEPLPEIAAAPGLAATELSPPAHSASALGPSPFMRVSASGGPIGTGAGALLNGLGVTRYDQIAAWDERDVARIDAEMGAFKGRIARDRWVEQAGFLAADDQAGFEERFGKLG